MKNFTYENQGPHTYLVYTVSDSDIIDSISLGMLTNNKIPGLASVIFTQMDTVKYLKYNVSSRVSVKQFFQGQVNKKRLLGVFNGIVKAMLSIEDYMIDPNTIMLDLDYIFADVTTCDTVLVCLPIVRENEKTDVSSFFKNIMFSTQFDQTENCDHVAKIINYLNSSPAFSLTDFKKILDSIETKPQEQYDEVKKAQPQMQAPVKNIDIPQNVQQQPTVQTPKQPVMQIPQVQKQPTVKQPAIQVPPNRTQTQQTQNIPINNEDKISLFYLLQHYNKENAAKYKAQKAAKKAGAGAAKKGNNAAVQQNVPNVPPKQSFAIPGQPAPAAGTSSVSTAPNAIPQQPRPQPTVQPTPAAQPMNTYQTPVMPKVQTASFGETTVLGGGVIGETTVLSGSVTTENQVNPHLIRLKNNERIQLNKPIFRIGKEKSYVDYFIGDNTAISRSHANIISRDGDYFIVDTNSTNHTFVNGSMIQSNVEVKLFHGCRIRLANEEFEFKIY